MSLFQTKAMLSGIGDARPWRASRWPGEYDRKVVSSSMGTSESHEWFSPHGYNESVSYQTQRQRVLTPGEIASCRRGRGCCCRGADWGLIGLTRWFEESRGKVWARMSVLESE